MPLYPNGLDDCSSLPIRRLICIASMTFLLGASSSGEANGDTRLPGSTPVRVELYEGVPTKAKSSEKALAPSKSSKAFNEGFAGPNDDDFIEPETQTGVLPLSYDREPDRVYQARAFGFHRLPFKYDETGVRELPKGPILFNASARLTLAQGTHRILIRSRNDAVFLMDGQVIANVKAIEGTSDGHNPVREVPALISPTIKEFSPGNAETVFALLADGQPHAFALQTLIGQSDRRPEVGDFSVAIAGRGEDSFTLLGSNSKYVFSDQGWFDFTEKEDAYYQAMDSKERYRRSIQETKYWEARHAYAKQWLAEQPSTPIPEVGKPIPEYNAIDRFIGRSIEEAALRHNDRQAALSEARAKGQVVFQTDIKPILEENCMKCHADKEKGGLRLDSLEHALRGGDSDEPAIVSGRPEESLLIELIESDDKEDFMPPKGDRLSNEERELLSLWIKQGAPWQENEAAPIAASRHPSAAELKNAQLAPLPLTDDLAFLRRLTLDTAGVIPTIEEIKAFEANPSAKKRSQAIDRLIEDARWADHWLPFWQDILAENPNIVKPNLNNTGAFRWWIYESFLDNKPMDRFATDLIRMRGDKYVGPAGFGMATQNDAPMAAKATILGGTFLGVQMKCARCHDAPFQSVKQEELFNMAAMLEGKPIKVPATSLAATANFSNRDSRVKVSLEPDQRIDPSWPFAHLSHSPLPAALLRDPDDPRQSLAAYISSPSNTRFAKAIVNWTWKRYFGKGLVEPALDWENADVSHPELLDYLADELVRNDYDLKHICRLILNSHTYQRAILKESNSQAAALFAGHTRRRMTAEQILDSLHLATGRRIDSEELNMDQDGRRPIRQFINLGKPRRAWEFTSLSNERDRPSLTLPHAQVYVDVLEAYGWNGSRQNPIEARDHQTNVMQPAVMANGIMSQRLTRLSDKHPLTKLALEDRNVEDLVETLFLKTLGRHPDESEGQTFVSLLREGYEQRVIPEDQLPPGPQPIRYPYITWSNHLKSEANEIKEATARDIEAGEPPTRFLQSEWRTNLEDGLWALTNSPEMIFVP